MKLVVFGASRGIGRIFVEKALAAGHEVTALVRNPDAFQLKHEKLKVVQGDIFDPNAVESVVRGQDAVISTVGPTQFKIKARTTVYSHGAANIVKAMEKHNTRRLIWTTSGAVDPVDLAATGFFFSKIFTPLFLAGFYADARISEEILRKSKLDWTVSRPTKLTNGPCTGVYRVDPSHIPPKGKIISRQDVADFMIKQLTSSEYIHKTPVLAY